MNETRKNINKRKKERGGGGRRRRKKKERRQRRRRKEGEITVSDQHPILVTYRRTHTTPPSLINLLKLLQFNFKKNMDYYITET